MKDKIKEAYKDLWKPGSEREEMVKGLLTSWGFEVEPFGFMALSDEYTPEWSDEKGVPDLKITNIWKNQQMLIEVTGTDNINERAKIWIREHKVDYAQNHKDTEIFVAHVISAKRLVRFVKITNLDTSNIPKEERILHNIPTNFYIIPWNLVKDIHWMKNYLTAWRDRLI